MVKADLAAAVWEMILPDTMNTQAAARSPESSRRVFRGARVMAWEEGEGEVLTECVCGELPVVSVLGDECDVCPHHAAGKDQSMTRPE